MSKGAIYIASGRRYVKEAIQSASSLKNKMPDIRVTLFSTETAESPVFDDVIFIDKDERVRECPHMAKQIYIRESPYEYTLYLDTDTYICDDISEAFDLLERFDIAVSQAELRTSYKVKGVPKSFPDPNSGIVLFRKSPEVEKIFSDWLALYKGYVRDIKARWVMDQAALREALYRSDAKIATLASEYNCRFIYPVYIEGTVKILHGRYPDMEYVAHQINKRTKMRIFLLGIGTLSITDKHPMATLLLQRFRHILKKRSRL